MRHPTRVLSLCALLSTFAAAPAIAGPPITVAVDEGKMQCGPASAARAVWSLFGPGNGFASIQSLYDFLRGAMQSNAQGTAVGGFIAGKFAINIELLAGVPEGGTRPALTTTGYAAWGNSVMDYAGFSDLADAADHAAALAAIKAALADPNSVVEVVVADNGVMGFSDPHCYNVTGVTDLGGGTFGFTGVQDPVQGDGVAAIETFGPGAAGAAQTEAGPFDANNFAAPRDVRGNRVGFHILYVFIEKKTPWREGTPLPQPATVTDKDAKTPHAPKPARTGTRWSPSSRW